MPLVQDGGQYQQILETKKWKQLDLSLSLSLNTADPARLLGLKCTLYNRCYWAQSFHCMPHYGHVESLQSEQEQNYFAGTGIWM